MRKITPQTPPPASFVQYVLSTPAQDYGGMPTAVKDELRAHLYAEQNGRCAYCERSLNLERTKIEHFHPQNVAVGASTTGCASRLGESKIDRSDLSIKNMLLCCPGGEAAESDEARTCDTRKGNQHICEDLHTPKNLPPTARSIIDVLPSGHAEPALSPRDRSATATVIDEVLNLNERRLRNQRSVLFAANLGAFMAVLKKKGGLVRTATLRQQAAANLRERARTEPLGSTLESLADEIES